MADEGDVYLDVVISPQVGWLTHPLAAADAAALPFAESSMFAVKPAFAPGVRRGVTDALHVGIGFDVAGSTQLTGQGVTISYQTGSLLTAAHVELAAPVTAGWRFDSESNLTGLLELQAAPMAVFWGSSAFADPTDLDESGLPAKLPVDIEDTWHLGGLVRAQALFEARIWDVFVHTVKLALSIA